jgi:hypothetical protein
VDRHAIVGQLCRERGRDLSATATAEAHVDDIPGSLGNPALGAQDGVQPFPRESIRHEGNEVEDGRAGEYALDGIGQYFFDLRPTELPGKLRARALVMRSS